ncbi:MAG: YxeA family protein [Ruminococcaceae bacterium]|nr:YxeA family protein [Oscillospiraceae bacterium]
MKKHTAVIIVVALSIVTILSMGVWFLLNGKDTYYYTQIDTAKMTENEEAGRGGVIDFTGGMRYLYTLTCYDGNGKEKELNFGANKELRDQAFLKLTVRPVQGVVAWEEVQYNDMPDHVKEKYTSPQQ